METQEKPEKNIFAFRVFFDFCRIMVYNTESYVYVHIVWCTNKRYDVVGNDRYFPKARLHRADAGEHGVPTSTNVLFLIGFSAKPKNQ